MARTLAEIQQQWDKDTADQGYREIPGFSRYMITMYGTVKNKLSNRELASYVGVDGMFAYLASDDMAQGSVRTPLKPLVDAAFPHREFKDIKKEVKPGKKSSPPKQRGGNQRAKTQKTPEVIENELWRPIPDFPNYEISDHKRVRRVDDGYHLNIDNGGVMLRDGISQYRRSVNFLRDMIFQDLFMAPGEMYRPLPGYDDIYEISNMGRIRRTDTFRLCIERQGVVNLNTPKKTYRRRVHKLLMEVWGVTYDGKYNNEVDQYSVV